MGCFWTDEVGCVEDCKPPVLNVKTLTSSSESVSLAAISGNIIQAFGDNYSATSSYYDISTNVWSPFTGKTQGGPCGFGTQIVCVDNGITAYDAGTNTSVVSTPYVDLPGTGFQIYSAGSACGVYKGTLYAIAPGTLYASPNINGWWMCSTDTAITGSTLTWNLIPSPPLVGGYNTYANGCFVNGRFYIQDMSNNIFCYDVIAGSWTQIPTPTDPNYNDFWEAFDYEGSLAYINSNGNNVTSYVAVYDEENKTWVEGATLDYDLSDLWVINAGAGQYYAMKHGVLFSFVAST